MAVVYPNVNNLEETVKEGLWILDFYTDHCGPCKVLDKIISEIVIDNPDINWAKCNLEPDNWDWMEQLNLIGTPHVLIYLDGERKDEFIGAKTREFIEEKISNVLYGD